MRITLTTRNIENPCNLRNPHLNIKEDIIGQSSFKWFYPNNLTAVSGANYSAAGAGVSAAGAGVSVAGALVAGASD